MAIYEAVKANIGAAIYMLKAMAGVDRGVSLFDFDVGFEMSDREISESLSAMSRKTGYQFLDESLSHEKIRLYRN